MSHKRTSENIKSERLRTVRILFAAILAVFLIAAVCMITFFVRRDTPAKAIRSTMKHITDLDESFIEQITATADAEGTDKTAVSAMRRFYEHFSCSILSVSEEKDKAEASVRITTPDASLLAADIRTYLLTHPEEVSDSDGSPIYDLADRFLSQNEYPLVRTDGSISLTRSNGKWTIVQDDDLSSLLLGRLPEALSDPYLLTPEQVLTAYLDMFSSMSADEWSDSFRVNDLFATYAADYKQIDTEFITRAKEAYAYSDVQADTDGASSTVTAVITGIDTAAILQSFKEKLRLYGETFTAITDDSAALSAKSAQLLLEAIRENESVSDFSVTVPMENNGTGWVITDSSGLTDALFGGMSAAVEQFSSGPKEDS